MGKWLDIAGSAGLSTAADTVSGLIGRIGQKKREERQVGYQKDIMGLQLNNQMALNQQGQDIQLDTWKKTSYPAQLAMMKEAGLNPALMYGMGGGGGTTTGSQGGGNASGGGMPNVPGPMDIRSNPRLIKEMELMDAQAENLKADAGKKRAETPGAGQVEKKMGVEIGEIEGRIKLNASQESLNKASEDLKIAETQVQQSISKVNDSLAKLNDQKVQESIKQTEVTAKTLDWMERTGLNPNDSQIAKIFQYLGDQTEIDEETLIYIIGGAIGLERLAKLIPDFIFKKLPKGIIKGNPIGGFGKGNK